MRDAFECTATPTLPGRLCLSIPMLVQPPLMVMRELFCSRSGPFEVSLATARSAPKIADALALGQLNTRPPSQMWQFQLDIEIF